MSFFPVLGLPEDDDDDEEEEDEEENLAVETKRSRELILVNPLRRRHVAMLPLSHHTTLSISASHPFSFCNNFHSLLFTNLQL